MYSSFQCILYAAKARLTTPYVTSCVLAWQHRPLISSDILVLSTFKCIEAQFIIKDDKDFRLRIFSGI